MKYKVVKGICEEELLKDIEEKLDSNDWFGEGCIKEVMFVPVGIIRKDAKISAILEPDKKLIK